MSPTSYQCSSFTDMISHWCVGFLHALGLKTFLRHGKPPFHHMEVPSTEASAAEGWLRAGSVAAKSPTLRLAQGRLSRRKREKWGTRRFLQEPALSLSKGWAAMLRVLFDFAVNA